MRDTQCFVIGEPQSFPLFVGNVHQRHVGGPRSSGNSERVRGLAMGAAHRLKRHRRAAIMFCRTNSSTASSASVGRMPFAKFAVKFADRASTLVRPIRTRLKALSNGDRECRPRASALFAGTIGDLGRKNLNGLTGCTKGRRSELFSELSVGGGSAALRSLLGRAL